jgi:DHA1 family multidrug resistance protein-like MFS transporter
MQEEDYAILRNEADASPERFAQWDPHHQLRHDYFARHGRYPTPDEEEECRQRQGNASDQPLGSPLSAKIEEEAAPLSRHASASSASTSSSSSASSDEGPRLEEVRTARSSHREAASILTTHTENGGILHRHPTERNPEALRRIDTHRSQHAGTVGASEQPSRLTRTISRRRTEKPLPSLGAGKPFPPLLPDREEYVVEFEGADDPLHAQNWPMKKKVLMSAILAFDALSATMGSSIFSGAASAVSREFGVGREVATLGTSVSSAIDYEYASGAC